MSKSIAKIMEFAERFQPFSKVFPNTFRLSMIVYSLIVLYRVNGNKIHIFESIGVAIFPAFFIAYIATVSPQYLNLLEPLEDINDETPQLGFFEEHQALWDRGMRTLLIFTPIYLLITYKLNKKLIHKIFSYFVSH